MEGIHQIGDQLFITRKPTKIHEKVAFFPKKTRFMCLEKGFGNFCQNRWSGANGCSLFLLLGSMEVFNFDENL
jgi:hypothetical protein